MAIITVPITYVDGVDVVHGQDITDTQETAIDAREKALMSIVNVSLNSTTGVFTFTRGSGATFTLDTLLEKVVTNFYYDGTTQELVLVLEDGTEQRISLSAFIDVYTGVDGDMITVSVSSGNAISAVLKDGTITKAKLASAVQTSLGKADSALQSVPQATSSVLGGIKADAKTSADTQEIHIDSSTGKLYTTPSSTFSVIDDLTSISTTDALSANQGRVLNSNKQDKITALNPLSADLLQDGTTNKVFTAGDQYKLGTIETGANKNVQADWTESDSASDAYIKNRPNLGTASSKDTGTSSGNVPVLDSNGKLSTTIIPQATDTTLGGIKADAKTTADTQEVHIDTSTGKLYTQPSGGGSSITVIDNLMSSSATDALSANQGRVLDANKVSKVSQRDKLYGTDTSGAQTTYDAVRSTISSDSGSMSDYIPIFIDGRTKAKTPIDDYDVANKKYVDNNTSLFKCTYGTTTYAEITTALADNKLPVCEYNNRLYAFVVSGNNIYYFSCLDADRNYIVSVASTNVWVNEDVALQKTNERVTTISSSSTNYQYPSALAVYNAVNDKTKAIIRRWS